LTLLATSRCNENALIDMKHFHSYFRRSLLLSIVEIDYLKDTLSDNWSLKASGVKSELVNGLFVKLLPYSSTNLTKDNVYGTIRNKDYSGSEQQSSDHNLDGFGGLLAVWNEFKSEISKQKSKLNSQ
jgi:hypothetical protein